MLTDTALKWWNSHFCQIARASPNLHMIGDLFCQISDFQNEACMSQSKPSKHDGELRIDAEKIQESLTLPHYRELSFNFSHIVFLYKIYVKGFQGYSPYTMDLLYRNVIRYHCLAIWLKLSFSVLPDINSPSECQ